MYLSDYRRRLETAISKLKIKGRYGRGRRMPANDAIGTAQDLLDAIECKATTGKVLRDLFWSITHLLEPPPCYKSHCPENTGYAFCNCALGRVPGRCPDNRAYLKRKAEREEKRKAKLKTVPKEDKKRYRDLEKKYDKVSKELKKINKKTHPLYNKLSKIREQKAKLVEKYKHLERK